MPFEWLPVIDGDSMSRQKLLCSNYFRDPAFACLPAAVQVRHLRRLLERLHRCASLVGGFILRLCQN